MAATIAMTMGLGATTVVAPDAGAQTLQLLQSPSAEVVQQYEELSPEDEKSFHEGQANATGGNGLLNSEFGLGWCIDNRLATPTTDSGSYEVRKLTGQSGNYGNSLSIDSDIEKAAIAVTKKMIEDYKAGRRGEVSVKNRVLQALLSNNLGYLNKVREPIHYSKADALVSNDQFEELTGFSIKRAPVSYTHLTLPTKA